MPANAPSNVTVAREKWGDAAPEWIIVLAEACDRQSQNKVAKDLGVSGAMINQALRNSYAGRMDKLEQRIRGELMRECVACPVLGEITKRKCIDAQTRAPARTNALRVELRRECPKCPNQIAKDSA